MVDEPNDETIGSPTIIGGDSINAELAVPVVCDDTTLTDGETSLRSIGDLSGTAEMTDDPRIEQIVSLIRAIAADADKRATDELVARLSGNKALPQARLFDDQSPDKRAPRGSAGVLIDRALSGAGDKGLTVFGIQAKAETEFEKMVTLSAIRNWLKENERKRPPRYRQVGGVWFLAGLAPTMKVVG